MCKTVDLKWNCGCSFKKTFVRCNHLLPTGTCNYYRISSDWLEQECPLHTAQSAMTEYKEPASYAELLATSVAECCLEDDTSVPKYSSCWGNTDPEHFACHNLTHFGHGGTYHLEPNKDSALVEDCNEITSQRSAHTGYESDLTSFYDSPSTNASSLPSLTQSQSTLDGPDLSREVIKYFSRQRHLRSISAASSYTSSPDHKRITEHTSSPKQPTMGNDTELNAPMLDTGYDVFANQLSLYHQRFLRHDRSLNYGFAEDPEKPRLSRPGEGSKRQRKRWSMA